MVGNDVRFPSVLPKRLGWIDPAHQVWVRNNRWNLTLASGLKCVTTKQKNRRGSALRWMWLEPCLKKKTDVKPASFLQPELRVFSSETKPEMFTSVFSSGENTSLDDRCSLAVWTYGWPTHSVPCAFVRLERLERVSCCSVLFNMCEFWIG